MEGRARLSRGRISDKPRWKAQGTLLFVTSILAYKISGQLEDTFVLFGGNFGDGTYTESIYSFDTEEYQWERFGAEYAKQQNPKHMNTWLLA